jgi:hypothetical protein
VTPKRLVAALTISILPLVASGAFGQNHEVPPSASTSSSVLYISDYAVEQCVVLYNKAKWLTEEIEITQVDQYSQASVDAYNNKVTSHATKISTFNSDCAGKQSESAYKTTQELNKKIKNS